VHTRAGLACAPGVLRGLKLGPAALYIDGRLVERLEPGRHAFWTVDRKVEIKRLDLRPHAAEITAQEMLTKDRVALQVTLMALRRIADPERAVAAVTDVDAWLYRLVQFAIRGAVAARTLDEVLSAKAALDAEPRTYVRERRRLDRHHLIRRQEETAATRSLLNTAKLMEENPLVLRLKELESVERLVEKVGRIELHAGEGVGLDALLTRLVRLQRPDAQSERA
jgi:SPFH domain / Band 7 family